MSTTSSSDEDDDFSKFASCAVSADQIEKDAQVEARKRVVRASQRPISSAARPAAASTHQQQQKGGSDEPTSTAGLDLVSVKIAAALDAILARELDEIGSGQPSTAVTSTPKAASAPSSSRTAAPAASTPSGPAGSADTGSAAAEAAPAPAAGEDLWDDGTGVQLFRAVPKGTPCVVQQHNPEGWDLLLPGQQQQQDAGGGFGGASCRQKKPLRDLIPRLSLAERSREASKRKHETVLAALAVDGKALRAAAAAAGYPSSSNSCSSSKANGGCRTNMSTTAGWVKGWKRMKGQKAEGVVMEAKAWVPYDVRAAKLLGTQPLC